MVPSPSFNPECLGLLGFKTTSIRKKGCKVVFFVVGGKPYTLNPKPT